MALTAAMAVALLVAFNRFTPAPRVQTAAVSKAPPTPNRADFSRLTRPTDPVKETLSDDDRAFLDAVAERVFTAGSPLPSDSDMIRLDRIERQNSGSVQIRQLALFAWALQGERAFEAGSASLLKESLDKMRLLDPRHPRIFELEAYASLKRSEWADAETAVRTFESVTAPNLGMSLALATSLQGQGRAAEAMAVLDRPVFSTCRTRASSNEAKACETAQQLRRNLEASTSVKSPEAERARAALVVSGDKEQIQSDRFDVRFDGENQSGLARDVLFVLDRAYTRLADIYYERPSRKVPVVLHASRDYYSATGAPWWSGGQYSSHNGAIQIPIRGLPTTLPREMEDVLVHELSHAFVDDMSGGRAGRDLQEGLAQYVSGKRIETELTPAELKRLANSNGREVMNFYMLSLAVSEQLVRSRGQGMVNELLKAMKDAGSEDAAFRKVFGQPGATIKREILETFWRRYS